MGIIGDSKEAYRKYKEEAERSHAVRLAELKTEILGNFHKIFGPTTLTVKDIEYQLSHEVPSGMFNFKFEGLWFGWNGVHKYVTLLLRCSDKLCSRMAEMPVNSRVDLGYALDRLANRQLRCQSCGRVLSNDCGTLN